MVMAPCRRGAPEDYAEGIRPKHFIRRTSSGKTRCCAGVGQPPLRAPSAMGRVPRGPAHRTAILSQPTGVETALGVVESAEGRFTRPGAIAPGVIRDRGDRDRGELPRARQAGPWHGVPAGGVDPVARLLGAQRGGPHPALVAFFHAITVAPVAARAGVIDADKLVGLGWHLAEHLSAITLAGADGPKVHALGAVILNHVRHSDGVRVHLHATEACVRLRQG